MPMLKVKANSPPCTTTHSRDCTNGVPSPVVRASKATARDRTSEMAAITMAIGAPPSHFLNSLLPKNPITTKAIKGNIGISQAYSANVILTTSAD